MYRTHHQKAHRGFTLTEAAIVLGIVGMILGAIWTAAAAVYSNNKIQTMSKQLVVIVSGIRSMYGQRANIDNGDITTSLAKSGVIPADLVADKTEPNWTMRTAWGGTFSVSGNSAMGRFFISLGNIPREACINLLLHMTGMGRDPGLITVMGAGGTHDVTAPMTVSQATTTCGTATPFYSIFVFKFRA